MLLKVWRRAGELAPLPPPPIRRQDLDLEFNFGNIAAKKNLEQSHLFTSELQANIVFVASTTRKLRVKTTGKSSSTRKK